MKRRRVLKNLQRKARRFKTPIEMQITRRVPIIPRMRMMTRRKKMMIMMERMMMKTRKRATMMTERTRKTMMKMPDSNL